MKFSIAILLAGAALSLGACNSKPNEQAGNSVDNGAELNATAESEIGNTELTDNAAQANEAEAAAPESANASTNAD